MRLRRAALWIGGAVAALGIAATPALVSFDLDAYRRQIADAVAAQTGRSVSFEGPLSLSLSLQPELVLEGVALGNPPGMSRPHMARVERLEAEARLWPLLRGRVEIVRLVLSGADLLLERDADGRANWEFPATGKPQADAALPRVEAFLVERSVVAWRDDSGATSIEVGRLQGEARDGAFEADFAGAIEGRPIGAKARLLLGSEGVAARDLTLRVDGVEAKGELALGLGSERPKLDGSLALGALDLDRLLPPAPSRRDGRLVPDIPLDGLPLDLLDLDLALRADRLVAGGRVFDGVAARIEVEAGRLVLRDASAGLAQGRLTVDGEARTRANGALAARVRLDLAQAELGELAPRGPMSGRIDVKADLRGEGRTLRALVGTLAGEARLIGRDGRIAGRELDLAAADLLRLLAPWTERGADTKVSCMLFSTTISQGRAEADALVLDSDRVLVMGAGTIDLGRERLDLKLTPRPKEASLFSLATPVNARGPLRDPSVSPDEAGLLRGAAGALLGNLVLPGAGFLLPFLSTGADDHPCAATLAAAKPGAAARPAGEEGGVGGFFRGLGRGIDRALGTGR